GFLELIWPQDAEEPAQEQVLGVHGHVRLELALPPALLVLEAAQVVNGGSECLANGPGFRPEPGRGRPAGGSSDPRGNGVRHHASLVTMKRPSATSSSRGRAGIGTSSSASPPSSIRPPPSAITHTPPPPGVI